MMFQRFRFKSFERSFQTIPFYDRRTNDFKEIIMRSFIDRDKRFIVNMNVPF